MLCCVRCSGYLRVPKVSIPVARYCVVPQKRRVLLSSCLPLLLSFSPLALLLSCSPFHNPQASQTTTMHPQLLLATTLSLSSYTLGAHPPALTTPQLMPRASTSIGCFNSSTGLVKNGTNAYNTAGLCQTACVGLALPVLGLSGQECWCGETLPPLVDRQADDGACDTPCPGYPLDMCTCLPLVSLRCEAKQSKAGNERVSEWRSRC